MKNGSGIGVDKSVKVVNGEVSGNKIKYEGENIISTKTIKPAAAERFWSRLEAKGDKLVSKVLGDIPAVDGIAGKSEELDLQESQLDGKRARIEGFKQAKSLSGLTESVRDVFESKKSMLLGDFFDKPYNLNRLSEEDKAAYIKKAMQSQKE